MKQYTIRKAELGDLKMNWNGVLVTNKLPVPTIDADASYRGVAYGWAWPLENMYAPDINDKDTDLILELNELHSFYYSDGTYPLEVVANLDLISRYVERCRIRNISVRTLLCATERSEPILSPSAVTQVLDNAKRLGYDYAYSSGCYSAVYEDIFPTSPFLASFCDKLNKHGLFETTFDLSEFIKTRQEIISSAIERYEVINGHKVRVTPLEEHGDFLPIEVWEFEWRV